MRLAAAGKTVAEQGDALITALGTLESALAGSLMMAGTDGAGVIFAQGYEKGGQAVLSAVESAVNALRNVGYGVEVSAYNYAVSEAASHVGGSAPSVPVPTQPGKYAASSVPTPFGPPESEPPLWHVVAMFVDGSWPNGNPPTLRAAASAWRAFGSTMSVASGDANAAGGLTGHDIPEMADITTALSTLTNGTHDLAGQCNSLASALDSFAGEVQSSQDAIRDLLHRLSLSGILDEIGKIFSGHNPMDDLKKIGHDISEILHTLSREMDAASSAFQVLIDGMDGLIRDFEKWDRKEFAHFFGDKVGSVLASQVNGFLDLEEGGPKSLLTTAGSIPAMLAHPVDTVKGIWELDKDLAEFVNPLGPMLDPEGQKKAGEHLLDVAKGVVDYKDWTSDRPLVGLGTNIADVAQILVPGLGEAKAGVEAGKMGEEGAQIARAEGAVERGGLGALAEGGGKQIADQAGKVGKDLDSLSVKPAEVPKVSDPAPATRPVEAAPPTPKPPEGAAAGNSGAGKAPVDAGARPASEPAPAAPHESVPAHPSSVEPAAPNGAAAPEAPANTGAPHGAGDGPHESAPMHPSSAEPTTPSSAAPHELPGPHEGPAPHETAEGHSGSEHSEADGDHGAQGNADHGGGHSDLGNHDAPAPKPAPVEGHDYGFSPEHAFEHSADRQSEIARLHEGGVPPSVTDGYEPMAGRTEAEFKHDFTVTDEHGRVRWDWDGQAPNNGFAGEPSIADRIPEGYPLDRLGSNDGGFMADEGAPLSTRAMPPGVANDYHTFVGTGRPIPDGLNWQVQYGPAKDAFGQPGGANQWSVIDMGTEQTVPVDELIRKRLIRETTPGK